MSVRTFVIGVFLVALAAAFLSYRTEEVAPLESEFGGMSLRLEVADTNQLRLRGLGRRTFLPATRAMLFAFPYKGKFGFWMKDMLVPIDIYWLSDTGEVVSFTPNVDPATYPSVFYPTEPVRYVLETAGGFSDRYGVATGSVLKLQKFPIVSE